MNNLDKQIIDLQNCLIDNLNFQKNDKKIILFANNQNTLKIEIQEEALVELIILFLPSLNENEKKFIINFNLQKNSHLNLKMATLSNYNNNIEIFINLNSAYSKVDLYSAGLLNKQIDKKVIINTIHNNVNTYSNIKSYEILKDQSKGFVRCQTNLKKGSKQSEAHQELRLLVLDESVKANSDPILLIDENDIIASHANAIGMLDYDQMFYLMARGLTKHQAHQLIINGYFSPIIENIKNNDLKKYIERQIEEMI